MQEEASSHQDGQSKKLSSIDKGKIVERIVALMHKYPDTSVKVERNIFLPVIHTTIGGKREIDILLTKDIAGHPFQIAIECKNEQRPIDAPEIDVFAKKLDHVGIRDGIFVSASGYTKGAIEHAALDGIKIFTLKNLTAEALRASVVEAFHSILYLFCQIVTVYVIAPSKTYSLLQAPFYDNNGNLCGSLGDLVWEKWMSDESVLPLGGHEVSLELPAQWNFILDGEIIPVLSMTAVVDVRGLFGGCIGQATGGVYSLVRASDGAVNRNLLDIKIDVSQTEYDLAWALSEDDLQKLLERTEIVRLHRRIKIPRIIAGGVYYPHSKRVQKQIHELMRAFEAGEIPDPRPFNFQEMEGLSIRTAFEPLWEGSSSKQ
ncbi:MAG TPA: restriction endonuclease [Ktedonobacteraceae bacterium]